MASSYKTEMCKFFLVQRCRNGSACAYAHSEEELRISNRSTNRRPNICRFFAQGRCNYGQACRFSHSQVGVKAQEESDAQAPKGVFLELSAAALALHQALSAGAACDSSAPYEEKISELHQKMSAALQAASSMDATTMSRQTTDVDAIPAVQPEASLETESNNTDLGIESQSQADSYEESDVASTKASSMDSVSTPAGCSDTGECGPTAMSRMERAAWNVRRRGTTTVIMKNVPEYMTQGALISQFEDLSPCMRATFNFFYLPWNPRQGCNLGYAIINFFDEAGATRFREEWNEKDMLLGLGGQEKLLHIVPAILQGFQAIVRHFSSFVLAHHSNLRFRPLLRASPEEPLRAMSSTPELVEKFKLAMAEAPPY